MLGGEKQPTKEVSMDGGGREDKNKQLKALWHAAKTARRLFVVKRWGLLPWLMSGCSRGKGACPACWPITPCKHPDSSQTPCGWQLHCQKGKKTSLSVLLSSSILCGTLWLYVPRHSGIFQTDKVQTWFVIDKMYQCLRIGQFTFLLLWAFICWVSRWQHIKVCLPFWLCAVDWYAEACKVRTKTRKMEARDREAEKECLEKTLP